MTRNAWLAIVAFLLISSNRAQAQAPAKEGNPDAAVLKASEALNQGRPTEFVRAIHPEDRKRFQSALMAVVEVADKEGTAAQILRAFPGVKDVAALKKLDDVQFFTSYLRGTLLADPDMSKALAGSKLSSIGFILQGKEKDAAVVLIRSTQRQEDGGISKVQIIAAKKEGETWKMGLTGDIEAMVTMMTMAASGKRPTPPDPADTKVEAIGRISEKDGTYNIAYRSTIPVGDVRLSKLYVLSLPKDDADLDAAKAAKGDAINALIRRRIGLDRKP